MERKLTFLRAIDGLILLHKVVQYSIIHIILYECSQALDYATPPPSIKALANLKFNKFLRN